MFATNQKFCFWLAGSTRRRRRWRSPTPLMSGWQVSSPQSDYNCSIKSEDFRSIECWSETLDKLLRHVVAPRWHDEAVCTTPTNSQLCFHLYIRKNTWRKTGECFICDIEERYGQKCCFRQKKKTFFTYETETLEIHLHDWNIVRKKSRIMFFFFKRETETFLHTWHRASQNNSGEMFVFSWTRFFFCKSQTLFFTIEVKKILLKCETWAASPFSSLDLRTLNWVTTWDRLSPSNADGVDVRCFLNDFIVCSSMDSRLRPSRVTPSGKKRENCCLKKENSFD